MTLSNKKSKKFIFDFLKPRIYVITCLKNNKHYIGESKTVTARLCAHKNKLKRNIHENEFLQFDFNQYGEKFFLFKKLLFGYGAKKKKRLEFETLILLTLNENQCYNDYIGYKRRENTLKKNPFFGKTHTYEARQAQSLAKIGRKSPFLGHSQPTNVKKKISIQNKNQSPKLRRKAVSINSIHYESISEASEKTGLNRRLIRERCHNSDRFKNYKWL